MSFFHEWARDGERDYLEYVELNARIEFLSRHLFGDYEPTRGQSRFSERLADWLRGPGTAEDQRQLFELLEYLYFVGTDEYEILYRHAFRGPIMEWLIDRTFDLSDAGVSAHINRMIDQTWFCPVTDSMQIARFHHLNRIRGKDLRPDWRTLAEIGSSERIRAYMKARGLRRLVLLEDFVGTGTQASRAVRFAAELDDELPILFVPLIVCPPGLARLSAQVSEYGPRVSLQPSLVLPAESMLAPDAQPSEPSDFVRLRDLLRRLDPVVGAAGSDADERAFGFGKTGSLAVLYTNCPNNAPPVLHFESDTWSPLFPRSSRR